MGDLYVFLLLPSCSSIFWNMQHIRGASEWAIITPPNQSGGSWLDISFLVPADEARKLPASVHLPPGQTPGSRWAGGSGRYSRKSGKGQTWKSDVVSATGRVKSELLINNQSCGWNALLLLAVSLFIQQKRFHRPLRAQTEKTASLQVYSSI